LVRDLYAAADSVAKLFDYFFRRAWERCSDDARTLWRVVPFFAAPARREALAATAGLRGRYFYDALEELRGRSLLEAEEGRDAEPRYRAHPLVRGFGAARLRDSPDSEAQTRGRLVQWYKEFLPQPTRDAEDWAIFAVLDTEQENTLAVVEWALRNNHPQAPTLVQRLWKYLYIRGHWRQCEAFTLQALKQASVQEDTARRLWLASHLGWQLSEQGRVPDALEWLHQTETEILDSGHTFLLKETNVLNHLGQVYLQQADFEKAKAYETHFLNLAEETGDRHSSLVADYYLALIKSRQGKMGEAAHQYRNLAAEARDLGWERAEGYCAFRLAVALIQLGCLDEAERWLNHASEMANHWEEPLLLAHVLFGQAQLRNRRHDLVEARSLAQNAADLYQRLQARPDIKEVVNFLSSLDDTCRIPKEAQLL
jgi:tetratricopeptide (TPR) repeat protein